MSITFSPNGLYFTSDTHFGHANIINFCERPFSCVEEMDEQLISNWNRTVGKTDTVFHLGDFCLGGAEKWINILDRLNGKIHLIMGNHDLRNLKARVRDRFENVSLEQHIMVANQKIYLNHYPFLCFSGSYDGTWQLFGHVHTGKVNKGIDYPRLTMLFPNQYDVGVDNNDYRPISFNEIKKRLAKPLPESDN